jgi:hypothetical protein
MMQARLFGQGTRAYVFYEDYASDFGDRANGRVSTGLAVIDLSNPAAPRLEANKVLGFSSFYGWYGWGSDSVVPSGEQVVQIGSTFALSRLSYGSDSVSERRRAWLDVVDASNPADIAVTSVPLPGQGHTGLHRSGSGVLASHYEPSSDGRVRFYIDRFDLSNPRAPRTSNEINVPGSLLAWDSASDRAITVDYKKSVREDVTPAECHEATEGQGRWLPNDGALTSHPSDLGRCTTVAQTLKQVHVGVGRVAVEGSWPVPALLKINRVSVGDDRVFVGFTSDSYYYFLAAQAFGIPCDGPCEAARSANLLVLSRLSSGGLHASTLELPGREQYGAYVSQLLAVGTRAVVGVGYGRDLRIVESAGDALREISTLETSETPLNLEKHQNSVIMSLGYNGVRVVDVSR